MIGRLRQLIEELRVSDRKFAERAGASRQVIWNNLNGKRSISNGMVGRIVGRFGVSEEWLGTGAGETSPITKTRPPIRGVREGA